jgi:transposase
MMQRCGHVVIRMLGNVKHKTIEPLIKETMAPGTLVSTEAYSM